MPGPAPYTNNQAAIVFRVLLGIRQAVAVYGVQLHLMTAAEHKQAYRLCHFGDGFILREDTVGEFDRQRTAVQGLFKIRLREGFDERYSSTSEKSGMMLETQSSS